MSSRSQSRRHEMGANPAHFQDHDRPVEQVSWEDAQAFVQALRSLVGYVVVRWRRVYLTAGETRCHLTRRSALERVRSRSRHYDLWREHFYAVFPDPAGLKGGRVESANASRRASETEKAVDRGAIPYKMRIVIK
ncbi:hypothetical protein HW932_09060 [Allochromatium humboldtianum]|uniref:Uncharacterized protein n=1 Tax=Allochromatium humboldtianum TaxID=504901 RepID=A0A850RII8_9GAMM|nr:hypothetical protein [Allochromatium humboldtianum]NVZ09411.1 hypothetical protein [Allochromatium humboldtianum]